MNRQPLQPAALTWTALLGKWIDFARAALALPDTAEGRSWKAAVPAIIGLQALCFALRELDGLPADEQALGINRAGVLLERHIRELHQLFGNDPLHPMLAELIADAQAEYQKRAAPNDPNAYHRP